MAIASYLKVYEMNQSEYREYLKESSKEVDRIMIAAWAEINDKIASGEIDKENESKLFWDLYYKLDAKSTVFKKNIKLI